MLDEQRADARLDEGCKGGVDFALAAGFHDQDFQPEARPPPQSPVRPRIRDCSGSADIGDDVPWGTNSCSSPSALPPARWESSRR